jgi:ubiquinol-cytochrome c reductase cytochrome c subunit
MRRALLLIALVALVVPAVALAANGGQLFGRYCAGCHGPDGAGRLPLPSGTGPARDQVVQHGSGPSLLGVGALAADFYLRTGYMPLSRNGLQPRRSHLILGPAEIDALIAYVASLGQGPAVPTPHPERGDLSQGQQLFAERCSGCHQIDGAGGYVTGAVPPSLHDATDTQIAEAVRIGPYVMPSFSQKAISDAQLDSLIRYVDYTKHLDDRGGWSLDHVGPIPEGLVTWFFGMTVLVAFCLVIGTRLRRG